MATNKPREEARSRKPRHRRNLQMEELPTFTKWLTSFGHSGSCNDANSKSKLLNPANRPVLRPPVVLLDSSEDAVAVVRNVPEEEPVQAVAVDGSISARGGAGCCCWQSSKSTRRECALKFHISLRKRKVVANSTEAEGVAAVLNPSEKVAVVAVKDRCGCRCLRTFPIFGRRKSRVVGISDLQKEEGAVTDGANLRTEEVASSGSDLVKEEEVVIAPDRPTEEESGCCCGRWKCPPAFQICRRRKVVAGKEEVVVDVPKVEEEVANNNVNKQESDSVGCLQAFHICGGKKRVDDNPKTSEKEEVVSNDSSNLDVQNLQKEGSGCCSCFRCRPTFQICGRRRSNVDSDVPKPGREEKVVVDVSDLPGTGLVAAGRERHSRSAQGGTCWSGWLPRFFLCGERTAVDASNHREEEEKAPPDVRKEEEVVAIAVADGIPDHGQEKQVAAVDIPVLNAEEVSVSASDTPDLHKEENVSSGNIQDVRKEEIVDSGEKVEGGGCRCWGKESGSRQQHRSSRSREGRWPFQIWGRGWVPTLNICRGRKDVSVRIPKLPEEEGLVGNDVSDVHKEVVDAAGVTGVVAGTDNSKCRRGCGCWHSKARRRGAVTVDKEGGSGRLSKCKVEKAEVGGYDDGEEGNKERERKKTDRKRNSNFFFIFLKMIYLAKLMKKKEKKNIFFCHLSLYNE